MVKRSIAPSKVALATASLVPLGLATVLAQDAQAAAPQPTTCPSLDGLQLSSGTSCPAGPSGPGDRAESASVPRPLDSNPPDWEDISSNGPLGDIYVGEDFSCQVFSGGSGFFAPIGGSGEGPADCGTFLSFDNDLYGPSFHDYNVHPNGTNAPFGNTGGYVTLTPQTQSGVTGSGTAASPYEVTTTGLAAPSSGAPGPRLSISEIDSYVVGSAAYRTDITLTNATAAPISTFVYRGFDCLQGHSGAFDSASGGIACANSASNSPPGPIEELYPVTGGSHYDEDAFSTVWNDILGPEDEGGTNLPDNCGNCTGQPSDNDAAAALNWNVTVPAGGSTTISSLTDLSASGQMAAAPSVATQPASGVSQTAAALNGTVNPEDIAVTSCSFQWGTSAGYGASVPCDQSPGLGDSPAQVSAALSGLSPGTTYHYRAVATSAAGTNFGTDQSFTTAPSNGAPSVVATSPPSVTTSTAGLSGSVVPEGLLTSAHFEVGLDPKYSGGGPVTYTQSTPTQNVGSDFAAHNVTAAVSGLLPNALYHAHLVASNADGTVDGSDVTFMTAKAPAPGAPTLGQTADLYPISGLIFVKPPKGKTINGVRAVTAAAAIPKGQGFIPLTQARQVPVGSQIDALRGSLQLKLATAKKRRTQAATVNGSVFSLAQNRSGRLKGLATFSLKENAFKGAPSYTTCSSKKTTRQPVSPLAQIAKLSSKVLQTLHASDHGGKFRTKGRYSAATVRGTDWFTEDRCDGTLTKVRRGSVNVNVFRTRKTIVLKAGHSFLAKRF